jgi:hypothetical protein
VNCSFPDVVNGMLKAMGHEVMCGMGNVAILSNVFAGSVSVPACAEVKVLAHYQNLAAWRRLPAQREGRAPRVWIDGCEVEEVFARFADIQLTPEPVIEISGASGVPMLLALAAGRGWRGHAPGPDGLAGGYPVALRAGKLELDLPTGITREDAVSWNAGFEAEKGLTVSPNGEARFHGELRRLIGQHRASLAEGFPVGSLEEVCDELLGLREELLATA